MSCIEWTGAKTKAGYGMKRVKGKNFYTHRLAYEQANGPIPPGMVVMHSCDNPACVNPDHLSVGTQADNLADMHRKGRTNYKSGSDHGASKLAPTDIPFIRSFAGVVEQKDVAMMYGIAKSTVGHIQNRRTWRHVS